MQAEWFRTVQDALRTRKRKVPLTSTWLAIHEEYGVGIRSRSTLDLSDDDLDKLHAASRRLTGTDPLPLDLEKSRTALSEDTAQDKLGAQPVFSMLRVAATDGVVEVLDESSSIVRIPCVPGTYAGVRGAQLVINPEHIDQVIIIENGSAWNAGGASGPYCRNVIGSGVCWSTVATPPMRRPDEYADRSAGFRCNPVFWGL